MATDAVRAPAGRGRRPSWPYALAASLAIHAVALTLLARLELRSLEPGATISVRVLPIDPAPLPPLPAAAPRSADPPRRAVVPPPGAAPSRVRVRPAPVVAEGARDPQVAETPATPTQPAEVERPAQAREAAEEVARVEEARRAADAAVREAELARQTQSVRREAEAAAREAAARQAAARDASSTSGVLGHPGGAAGDPPRVPLPPLTVLSRVEPRYPATAYRLGAEGVTSVRVSVRRDGSVGAAEVIRSAGHPDLDRAAVDAVRRWRFEPVGEGAPAVRQAEVPVRFRVVD